MKATAARGKAKRSPCYSKLATCELSLIRFGRWQPSQCTWWWIADDSEYALRLKSSSVARSGEFSASPYEARGRYSGDFARGDISGESASRSTALYGRSRLCLSTRRVFPEQRVYRTVRTPEIAGDSTWICSAASAASATSKANIPGGPKLLVLG